MKQILTKIANGEVLDRQQTSQLVHGIVDGNYNDVQISALLTGLIMRGIKVDELLGLRDGLIETGHPVDLSPYRVIDIVGTGGDNKNTFNISTCACLVVAGAGYKVAKHGNYAATSTSGPGICLKSEAMNLAVIDELPLVVIDVQRGGPSTGLPTKSEQTDLLQVLFGRNGESPMPVLAATSPTDCFDKAYLAAKIALEHLTPVVLLTDAFVANGSGAWKLPDIGKLPDIHPHYAPADQKGSYSPYHRDPETGARYWAIPGQEGYEHILGGLEKDGNTGAISTDPENHDKMCRLRAMKVFQIPVPDVEVIGDGPAEADLLIVGFGGTFGHLYSAMEELRANGHKAALAHFGYINPLPRNTYSVLRSYKKVVVAEQNLGQFAAYLRMNVDNFLPYQFNQVKGQPFVVAELVKAFEKIIKS